MPLRPDSVPYRVADCAYCTGGHGLPSQGFQACFYIMVGAMTLIAICLARSKKSYPFYLARQCDYLNLDVLRQHTSVLPLIIPERDRIPRMNETGFGVSGVSCPPNTHPLYQR